MLIFNPGILTIFKSQEDFWKLFLIGKGYYEKELDGVSVDGGFYWTVSDF